VVTSSSFCHIGSRTFSRAARPDKPAEQIDTLDTVRALYEDLQHGGEHLVTAGARQ